ncbi:vasoactive intestinal polypeptide receptor-like [Acipenser oxyrinchus oxyrinchus]|uniref:Vasoactive intestinal polypeptide receptor-like n=1 Tax=Acipenser oxyrinchus oxyrinchus TaxID=40147 RepID=A0AAD8LPJ9_ACIOX|nr:vasoactive intestinal polypeptide receptor-like [Acipenser oxyrinchus oxyrinchus]
MNMIFNLYLLMTFWKQVDSIHPECAIISELFKAGTLCLEKQHNESSLKERHVCKTEWDGLRCWPRVAVGEVVSVICPDFFRHFTTKQGLVYRNCTDRGWTYSFPPYPEACDFDNDTGMEPENKKSYYSTFQHIYTAGYSTSLVSLITAIVVFTVFRKFHCTRNYIHMNLFLSFILRASAVFIKDAVLFADENMDHCFMSTVSCKAAVVFFQFSILANFFWLLVEGMYLKTLLALTFVSEKKYFWWYILVGWGAPTTVMTTWVLTRIYHDNHGCWDDNEDTTVWWIIRCPILFAVFVNFVIFVNVIRILVQKLKTPAVGGNDSSHFLRLAKSTLLLIPLLGVHYIVFAFFPENTGIEARLYIELGLGSFQGFFVALLYCFLNGEVQAELKKRLERWHGEGYLSFKQKRRALSSESSTVNFVSQLTELEKCSPKRRPSGYHNCISSV